MPPTPAGSPIRCNAADRSRAASRSRSAPTLYEEMVIDDGGRVVNPKFRDYHLPSFADIPRTEVLFADTTDAIGPMGAKSMSESPCNPVAAALGCAGGRHRFDFPPPRCGPTGICSACEEILHRGVATHGFRYRFRPWPALIYHRIRFFFLPPYGNTAARGERAIRRN